VALGPDLFNGSAANLQSFRSTGVSFPLLLNGALGAGNENLFTPYGDRDSYAVINKQGIVRYSAYLLWPYGNRYHLNELSGTIDSLVVDPRLDVGGGPAARGYALRALPNPFHRATTIELTNTVHPGAPGSITVLDVSGRRIATLWSGACPPGVTRVSWNVRSGSGTVPPGVYLVRSDVGGVRLSQRVVVLE
jgi:hypothetical protein